MRIDTVSKLMTLVAVVELAVALGLWVDHWVESYQGQRDLGCMLGKICLD